MKAKKLIYVILLLCSNSMYSQINFAPIGSTWFYSHRENWESSNIGYLKMVVSKDTIIQNRECKVLSRTVYHPNGEIENLADKIIHVGDSIVSIFLYNKFSPLYDFTKKAGDTLWVKEMYYTGWTNDTVFAVVIDSVRTENVQGENLLVQYVRTALPLTGWSFGGRVIEKFGNTRSFFPYTDFEDDMNMTYYPIRCFITEGFYYNETHQECDLLVGMKNEYNALTDNIIYPNPAHDHVYFAIPDDILKVTIYDNSGIIVENVSTESASSQGISVRHLRNGVFFLRLETTSSVFLIKLIKL